MCFSVNVYNHTVTHTHTNQKIDTHSYTHKKHTKLRYHTQAYKHTLTSSQIRSKRIFHINIQIDVDMQTLLTMQTLSQTLSITQSNTKTHTKSHKKNHTNIDTHTQTQIHTLTHTHKHTTRNTHTHKHKRTYTHKHTHT